MAKSTYSSGYRACPEATNRWTSPSTRTRQALRSMLRSVLSNLVVFLPGAYAFVVLKKDSGYTQETLAAELRELISKKIAKYAAPEYVQVTCARLVQHPSQQPQQTLSSSPSSAPPCHRSHTGCRRHARGRLCVGC